ncbi:MAG: hypothetical protein B7Z20_07195 [Sphingobium sp. 32-64-5]|nr:MAG: hypothetical protein B7Z20_07195 [Sphingobium sp. 32-64-5]
MKRFAPRQRLARAPFSWRGAVWTLALALFWLGLYDLASHHRVSGWYIMLLIFLAVPLATFMLSSAGQDRANRGGDRERRQDPRMG